jgi:GDPmannose 4,6-dehydratase
MTAIIFGSNGQDGFYLSKLLQSKGIQVIPVSRKGDSLQIDITNYDAVVNLISTNRPHYIFHLAANSTTWHGAWKENHETICTGTLNILEAVYKVSPKTKVFISGSGLQFKNDGHPIKETDAFEASSQYSVSRIHSVYAARYYKSLGVKAYVGYFFNHDSPRRTERHMAKKISEFAKRIGKGSAEMLEIGDVSVKKEWGFAGDIVEGIWALIQQDLFSEVIIGTGKAYSIQEWIEICFSIIGKNWKDYISVKQGYVAEYSTLVSDPSTIFSLGWQPKVSFQQLAKMMLEDL